MFTGIVEATGELRKTSSRGDGFRATIEAPFAGLALGESVAVNGVCLTVAALAGSGFEADISPETARVTTLAGLPPVAEVNLERALSAGSRLGGHFVSGHVDGIAHVRKLEPAGDAVLVEIEPPSELVRFIAAKGSVTLDGVSLTVNRVHQARFELMLVPHTLAVTTLKSWQPGAPVNLEVDVLARYVAHFLSSAPEMVPPR
ncbi:MAG: riboflavin synthase [Myxococcota bacterium]|jgi:riboflavin synthase|nr:riboflavin synthase [Myxococcota bacterium]